MELNGYLMSRNKVTDEQKNAHDHMLCDRHDVGTRYLMRKIRPLNQELYTTFTLTSKT